MSTTTTKTVTTITTDGPQASGAPGSGPGGSKARTVAQMGFSPVQLAFVTDTVRNLTIQDLEDLAARFAGKPVANAIVNTIRAVDLRGLEDLFRDLRDKALQSAAGIAGPGGIVATVPSAPGDTSVSCCTCTPCCCCGAAEIDPFRDL